MVHLNDFVFDVGGLSRPVILGYRLRSTDQHIADPYLTGVTLTVVSGKFFHQRPSKLMLTVHENPLPRDKHVIEDDQRFVPSEERVADIHLTCFKLPSIAGLASDDVRD